MVQSNKLNVKSYHNCSRTVRSSRYIVFDRKSIPIVACSMQKTKNKLMFTTAQIASINTVRYSNISGDKTKNREGLQQEQQRLKVFQEKMLAI